MKTFKNVIIYIILIAIGAGSAEIYKRVIRHEYIPKETKLSSSDISIDSIDPTWDSSIYLEVIARNISSDSIDGVIVFEVDLDPSYLDTTAIEKINSDYKSDKNELIKLLDKKLANPDKYSRGYKILEYVRNHLQGGQSSSERYMKIENTLPILDKYVFRYKHYFSLSPLEISSFTISSPFPPGYKFSKPTIRAISVLK